MKRAAVYCLFFLLVLRLPSASGAGKTAMRVGYFPNINHSQAIVGMAQGAFKKALGDDAAIEEKIFNAGPSVIEAIFAGALDLAYVGPNPAINGYLRSGGAALRIVAGATCGGAALVVRKDAGISDKKSFHHCRIATPQLGNTQDVSLRAWLKENGLLPQERGGDVAIVCLANPDQLTLFLKKEIDAAWTVEPWVSRLVYEAGGQVFLEEDSLWQGKNYATALVVVSKEFLDKHPELVKKWLEVHVEMTRWINDNPAQAKMILNQRIRALTGKALPDKVINAAMERVRVTYDPAKESLITAAGRAFEQGFLGNKRPDLSGIYDLRVLNEVLEEKKLPPIN